MYYGYRFYSPAKGRWLGRDPIGESGGLNMQAFVSNNPAGLFDPDGREAGFSYCPLCRRLIPPGRNRCSCGYRVPLPLPFNVGRSLLDRRSGNMLRSWWDDTEFYRENYAGCVADALAYFRRQIKDRADSLCLGRPMPGIEAYPVYGCLEGSHPERVWPTDPAQNTIENIFWLGDFDFEFSHFVALRNTGTRLEYSAAIVVVDKIGYQPRPVWTTLNRALECLFGGPQRTRIVAEFRIDDTLDCCP